MNAYPVVVVIEQLKVRCGLDAEVMYIHFAAFDEKDLAAPVDYGRDHSEGLEAIYFGLDQVMLIRHAFERDELHIPLDVFLYVSIRSKGVYRDVDFPTRQPEQSQVSIMTYRSSSPGIQPVQT